MPEGDMGKELVPVGEGAMAYWRQGEGPPVLLIHGIPTSSFLWRHVVPLLAPDLSAYAVDLLGYGDSDKPEGADLSIAAQAGYLRTFMESVGWRTGTVAGHDIGGGVAQLLAVRSPEMVSKLVLLDTIAYDSWPVPEIERMKEPAWDEIMERIDLRKGFRKSLERGMAHREMVDDDLVSEYVRPFDGVEGRRAYLRCARALQTEDLSSVADQVEALDIPTLVIWGDADQFQPLRYGKRLTERMRRAKLLVLADAGHFTPEDNPTEVAKLIGGFALDSPQAAHSHGR
jgi:2-hydroxymuconate-semialdehyde hydrolase